MAPCTRARDMTRAAGPPCTRARDMTLAAGHVVRRTGSRHVCNCWLPGVLGVFVMLARMLAYWCICPSGWAACCLAEGIPATRPEERVASGHANMGVEDQLHALVT